MAEAAAADDEVEDEILIRQRQDALKRETVTDPIRESTVDYYLQNKDKVGSPYYI